MVVSLGAPMRKGCLFRVLHIGDAFLIAYGLSSVTLEFILEIFQSGREFFVYLISHKGVHKAHLISSYDV